MIQGILLWVSGMAWVILHPFHVSICEIEYQENDRALEISCRMFIDDLEIGMKERTDVDNYFDDRSKSLINNDLELLLQENLKLELNGDSKKPKYLGFEIEDDVVWCFLEVEKVKSIKTLSVEYAVLFDTFEDQFNLVHVKYQGKVKSLRLHQKKSAGSISF